MYWLEVGTDFWSPARESSTLCNVCPLFAVVNCVMNTNTSIFACCENYRKCLGLTILLFMSLMLFDPKQMPNVVSTMFKFVRRMASWLVAE